MSRRSRKNTRLLATGLGIGSVVFGALPAAFPARFVWLFGIASAEHPTVATAIRSVGVRDVIIGVGLQWAARDRNDKTLRRWLLARAAADAGDAVAVSLAVAAGARSPRFLALGGLALGATLIGFSLFRAAGRR